MAAAVASPQPMLVSCQRRVRRRASYGVSVGMRCGRGTGERACLPAVIALNLVGWSVCGAQAFYTVAGSGPACIQYPYFALPLPVGYSSPLKAQFV